MIKLVFCLRRLPHLSREEFHRYWLDTHGPLVRELAPALGVKRYTQVHTVTSAFSEAMRRHRGAPEDFDGVAELWWDDYPATVAALSSAETMAAVADHANFMDSHDKCAMFITEEVVIVEGRN